MEKKKLILAHALMLMFASGPVFHGKISALMLASLVKTRLNLIIINVINLALLSFL